MILIASIGLDYVNLTGIREQGTQERRERSHLLRKLAIVESKVASLENELKYISKNSTRAKSIVKAAERLWHPLDSSALGEFISGGNEGQQAAVIRTPNVLLSLLNRVKVAPLVSRSRQESSFFLDNLSERIDNAIAEASAVEQKNLAVIDLIEEQNFILRVTPSIKPSEGWYSSFFGMRSDPFTGELDQHNGVDIAAREGTPVRAAAEGVVKNVLVDEDGYGLLVIIDHGYGVETRYGHVSEAFVKYGQKVSRTEMIAALGNSGRSTGPHLHYEVRINGKPVDPMNFIIERN